MSLEKLQKDFPIIYETILAQLGEDGIITLNKWLQINGGRLDVPIVAKKIKDKILSDLQVEPQVNSGQIETKNYLLKNYDKDSVWLENNLGEGMQIWANEFDILLDKYFKENF